MEAWRYKRNAKIRLRNQEEFARNVKTMGRFNIVIVKASYPEYWYANHIGERFVVEFDTYRYCLVIVSGYYTNYVVRFKDCRVIVEKINV